MDKTQGILQMTEGEGILMLTNLVAEIYPLLEDVGLAPSSGFVIFVEDSFSADILTEQFHGLGAILVQDFRVKSQPVYNYEVAVHMLKKRDKGDVIWNFLENGKNFRILLVCGFLPDYLQDVENLLVLKSGETEKTDFAKVQGELNALRRYVRTHAAWTMRELRLFKTSEGFFDCRKQGEDIVALLAVARILGLFWAERYGEPSMVNLQDRLAVVITELGERREGFDMEEEIPANLNQLLLSFVKTNPIVRIGEVDKVEGKLLAALMEDGAVLYDERWYFVPEAILREACEPLFSVISFPALKHLLLREGFLFCDKNGRDGFTTQKVVLTAYGGSCRKRFLKLRRDRLDSVDSLNLAECRQ